MLEANHGIRQTQAVTAELHYMQSIADYHVGKDQKGPHNVLEEWPGQLSTL